MLNILGDILIIIATVILSIILKEPVKSLLARLLGWSFPRLLERFFPRLLPRRKLEGVWYSVYTHPANPDPVWDIVELRHFGDRIRGESHESFRGTYKLDGELVRDTVFTGSWMSKTPTNTAHGALQLSAISQGNALYLKGYYLVVGNNNRVSSCIWLLYRVFPYVDPNTVKRALRDCASDPPFNSNNLDGIYFRL